MTLAVLGILCALAGSLAAPPIPTERYDAEQVIVETIYLVDEYGGREVVPRRPSFRTGAGHALTGPEFYAYVDRADLATAYRSRARRKRALIGVGIGMVAVGAGLSLVYIGVDGRPGDALLGSGAGLMLAGAVPAAIGGFMSPHPVSRATTLDLARAKNARLRKRLGLPMDLQLGPLAGRHGGGAQLSGAF